MAGKSLGFALAAAQIIAGILIPGAGALIIAGAATALGTALAPAPPRTRELADSPTYGIDRFDNPRGPETHIPILYGEHEILPAVIAESVSEVDEGVSPGDVANTRMQRFRWLGVLCEGPVSAVTGITINDRPVLSDLVLEELGTGTGSRKEFTFPHRWVVLGDDEMPGVEVFVNGVKQTQDALIITQEFRVTSSKTYDVVDSYRDPILGSTIRVFIRGQGVPEFEQLAGSGTYRWSAQKKKAWKFRLRFKTRPPKGYFVRVKYQVVSSLGGMTLTQNARGVTKALFSQAPSNGYKVTARYRWSEMGKVRIAWRPGTLEQQPIDGFTDVEQSRNPSNSELARAQTVSYDTGGREVDNLRIGLVAQRGMILLQEDGGSEARKVDLRIQYRKTGASGWKTLRSARGGEWRLVGERTGTMRWEIDVLEELRERALEGGADAAQDLDDFDRSAYDIQITRTTPHPSDALATDDIEWSYVTEITHGGFSYPGTALLALSGLVGRAIAGSGLRVSCTVRRAPLYDPRSTGSAARDLGSSQNPALAIRDLITSSEGTAQERFGGGFFFAGADLFVGTDGGSELDSLIAFADFCDAWVHRPGDDATRPASAANGERRCRLNVALDTPQSLMETVGDLAFVGYCFASLQGARWRFPLDQDGDAVFAFVDDVDPPAQNMSNFVLKLDEWGKSPTSIQGSFWNEAIRYERDELLLPVEDIGEDAITHQRDVDLRGITRETEAVRMLRHLAEQARALPFPCTWDAHPGIQHIEAGDIVTVKTRVPYSTGATATELKVRILATVVARDEEGRVSVRYSGRVMESSTYAISPASAPVSSARPPEAVRASTAARSVRTRRLARVTGLRATIRARAN